MAYPECNCTACRSHHLYQQATAMEDGDPDNGFYLLIHAVAQSAVAGGVSQQDFTLMTQEAFLAHTEKLARKRMN